jgi:hypothetical protein
LPTPEEVEVAELFLRKAASDLSAARVLARDPDQGDDVVGFHAQQVVEKSLKAVLAVRGFEIPRTHDLDRREFVAPYELLAELGLTLEDLADPDERSFVIRNEHPEFELALDDQLGKVPPRPEADIAHVSPAAGCCCGVCSRSRRRRRAPRWRPR